jgi:hypothetical protein
VTISADVGMVTQNNGAGTWSWSIPTTDGDAGPFTVTITADDGVAAPVTTTFTYSVHNVAPTVNADPPPIDENQFAQLTGDFTDPGVQDTHTVTIDWVDPNNGVNSVFNLPATTALVAGQTYNSTTDSAMLTIQAVDQSTGRVDFASAHQYLDDGPAPGNGTAADSSTITVTVADDDNDVGSDTTSVTVRNVAPGNFVLNSGTINEGGTFTLNGSFTDPGTLDVHTIVVNWGDGSTPQTFVLPVGDRTFTYTHTYADDHPVTGTTQDSLRVTVRITDDDGGNTGFGADGLIVVNHDEWTLSNTGFGNNLANTTRFVQNLANFFTGGQPGGRFLAYSIEQLRPHSEHAGLDHDGRGNYLGGQHHPACRRVHARQPADV